MSYTDTVVTVLVTHKIIYYN